MTISETGAIRHQKRGGSLKKAVAQAVAEILKRTSTLSDSGEVRPLIRHDPEWEVLAKRLEKEIRDALKKSFKEDTLTFDFSIETHPLFERCAREEGVRNLKWPKYFVVWIEKRRTGTTVIIRESRKMFADVVYPARKHS